MPYSIIPYSIMPYSIMPYSIIPYSIIPYSIILSENKYLEYLAANWSLDLEREWYLWWLKK